MDGGKAIEWFQMSHRSHIVRQEIARLLSERFCDADEILNVEPALAGLQPCKVGRRNRNGFGYLGPSTRGDAEECGRTCPIVCTSVAK